MLKSTRIEKPIDYKRVYEEKDPLISTSANLHPALFYLLKSNLKNCYTAERQLLKTALPNALDEAATMALPTAIKNQLKQTIKQIARLKQVFDLLDEIPDVQKKNGFVVKLSEKPSEDLAHFEIPSYDSLSRLAKILGMNEVADLLTQSPINDANACLIGNVEMTSINQ